MVSIGQSAKKILVINLYWKNSQVFLLISSVKFTCLMMFVFTPPTLFLSFDALFDFAPLTFFDFSPSTLFEFTSSSNPFNFAAFLQFDFSPSSQFDFAPSNPFAFTPSMFDLSPSKPLCFSTSLQIDFACHCSTLLLQSHWISLLYRSSIELPLLHHYSTLLFNFTTSMLFSTR